MRDARDSLTYGLPRLPRLELRRWAQQYVYAVGDEQQGKLVLTRRRRVRPSGTRRHARRLLAYQRVPGAVRFFLDRAVYQDTARALLPEIGAYCAGLIDHLLRAEPTIKVKGGNVAVAVTGARGAVAAASCASSPTTRAGARKEFGSWPARR